MKTVVIILDLILCFVLVYGTIVEFDTEYLVGPIVFILVIILLVLNIILIKSKSKPKPNKCWFRLYLKRKALEEKKKIEELSSK